MEDTILYKKIIVNWNVYLNGDNMLDFLSKIMDDIKSWYNEQVLEDLSDNIDMLLEVIEYNDWEE